MLKLWIRKYLQIYAEKKNVYISTCVNNYFGVGIDAVISIDFHHTQVENPDKFNSR